MSKTENGQHGGRSSLSWSRQAAELAARIEVATIKIERRSAEEQAPRIEASRRAMDEAMQTEMETQDTEETSRI